MMERNHILLPIVDEEGWETLFEFSVPSLLHNEHKVVEGVIQAIDGLEMSQAKITQLKTAVSEAAMNAIEHGNKYNPCLNVDIRVQVNPSTLFISISDQGAGGLIKKYDKPDLQEKLKEQQTPRGWGFFLIENMVDRMELRQAEGRNIIDLYLNRE
jgi:anti-sigma regulatory factor (Ser/Thr protein kinase)